MMQSSDLGNATAKDKDERGLDKHDAERHGVGNLANLYSAAEICDKIMYTAVGVP